MKLSKEYNLRDNDHILIILRDKKNYHPTTAEVEHKESNLDTRNNLLQAAENISTGMKKRPPVAL